MSTYCGKNCNECTYREELSCSGCQSGPGRIIDGDCKLARCCRDKGHETCETCQLKRNCGTWLDKGSIPKQRMERRMELQKEQEMIARRAPFLGKWLWILFWLIVPQVIINFMTEDFMLSLVPALEVPGQIGLVICMIIRVLVLFKLSKEHGSYGIAAILGIANVVASVVYLRLGTEDIYFLIMIAVVQLVILLISEYYEYKAHTEVVMMVDACISAQWDNYWKWNMYSCIGLVVSMFMIFLIPGLGALAVLASSIGILVAGIKKLVYLYQSAKVFRARAGQ